MYKPFQDYISNITNEQDCQLRLQEIAGSTFVRDNYVKKEGLIFLYGPKSTGKSGFLNLLNAILRNENTELNTQIEEYENGLRIVAQRIDDEGFPDIAEAIMSEDTIRSAFMRVADFISSTLKRGVQKVANSIGSVFHR